MTHQETSTQSDPFFPIRIGAHSYFVATLHEDPRGWTWERPSSESDARRVHRLATAPYSGARSVAPPKRERKLRLTTILSRAKKAGVTSVTIDGVTYRFGEAIQSETDRELAAFGARHGLS